MKKPQGRHVLVERQEVVHERRNIVDVLCFDGATSTPDQRHANSYCLPIRLQPGEKALVLEVQLLYCTNDTDREWRFQLQGELWDGQKEPLNVVVPPHAKGVVPSLDRLVYRNEVIAKCPEFVVQYLGQEHAIMGAHSTCVTSSSSIAAADFQLFKENDPFLQFLRRHWSTFPELNEFDIQLVPTTTTSATESGDIYQVSQRAVDRATHFFKTVFGKIRYKTRDTPLLLLSPPPPPPPPQSVEQDTDSQETKRDDTFQGVVVMLSLDYLVVAPAAPKCRVMDYPLNFI